MVLVPREPNSASTHTPDNLHIVDCSSTPGSRIWLAYNKKGEVIGELAPENDKVRHDGTTRKGFTSYYIPMTCDAEGPRCVFDIMSPLASYYWRSPEKDSVDRFLYHCIVHNPGVWSIARRCDYRSHNPSFVDLSIDRFSSNSVPWDIKHQWP